MEHVDEPSELQAKVLAGRLLSLGAHRSSESLDHFSGWLLAALGAALALLLANIDSVSRHLSVRSLRLALILFLCTLLVGVVGRLVHSIVGASARVATEAEPMGSQLAEMQIQVNFKTVFQEMEEATFWPMCKVVATAYAKVEQGDYAAGGRLLARLTQIQGGLVLLELALATAAGFVLAHGLAA